MLQGIAEMMRCWIAMRTGKWLERLDDVRETEDMLIHAQGVATLTDDDRDSRS